jgi:hypothetical protein
MARAKKTRPPLFTQRCERSRRADGGHSRTEKALVVYAEGTDEGGRWVQYQHVCAYCRRTVVSLKSYLKA